MNLNLRRRLLPRNRRVWVSSYGRATRSLPCSRALVCKPPSAHAIIDKVRPFLNPRQIRPGHDIQVVLHPEDKTVQGVELVVENNLLRVKATADGWLLEREEIPLFEKPGSLRAG